ncbi:MULTISPECIES: hypothetical protein [unclassified Mycoplasma]|uniref:hypothetical protein n=1 Tax=unclassified Mycoplasma TaxID=2683645 RepID=UPI00216ADC26|nr:MULTISPECIES: hypothetical protein [unclassified Mycoplasma]MCS4536999.1 hypothetical protein [Mycoplasma sp. CSL7475-4]MCT4469370.1 hypothetical protein [Mycoplasma sp. HS2188]
MKQIILTSQNDYKKTINAMERELDEIWELGLNNAELVFIDEENQNLWNLIIKYLDEHKDEFSYEIVSQNNRILVTFVI